MIDAAGAPAREARLADGTPVLVRPLLPSDAPLVQRGFDRLSPQTRYRRFLQAMDRLTPAQLAYLTDNDGEQRVAWAAATVDPATGELEGIGIARSMRDGADPAEAEFAIVIADAWQGRGVGRLLTRAVAADAYEHGVRRWRATMLVDNVAVQRLLRSVATERSQRLQAPGTIEMLLDLKPPTDDAVTP